MKTIRLLVVANNASWVSSRVKTLTSRFLPKLVISFDIVNSSYENIPFIQYPNNATGYKGVDHDWYDANVTSLAKGYDMVLFVMNLSQWGVNNSARGWRGDKNLGPVELQIGCSETENIYLDGKLVDTAFGYYAFHEMCHGFYLLSGQPDRTHEFFNAKEPEKVIDDLKFPEPHAVDNVSTLMQLLYKLQLLIDLLFEKKTETMNETMNESNTVKPKPDLLTLFCLAIQEHEGFYPGSRSFRNNNPGNVKFVGQLRATGKDKQGFAIFKTYEDGFNSLKEMIRRSAVGKSTVYNPDMTLYQYFAIYAPALDHNNPKRYAEVLAKRLGVEPTFRIKGLV